MNSGVQSEREQGDPERPAPRCDGTSLFIAFLTLLSIPILFYGLGNYSLVDGDEGFYHAVSRNMLETGDWLRLEFTGEHRIYDTFMNAPFQYWLRGNLIRFFGDNYWTMRIASAVFAWLSVLGVFVLVRRIATPGAGLMAATAQLFTFQFVYQHGARTGELEPMVSLALILAAISFLAAIFDRRSFLIHFLCVAVLANLKTPLVLLPLMGDLAYFVLVPEHRLHLRRWARAACLLPLGFTWHLGQLLHLQEEALPAFEIIAARAALAGTSGGLGAALWSNLTYYLRITAFGAFPFAVLYPLAIFSAFRTGTDREASYETRLLALYALVIYGFFIVVPTRLPWYVLPASPFLSALVGIWLQRSWQEIGAKAVAPWATGVATLVGGLALGVRFQPFNPFASRGMSVPLASMEWRDFGGLGAGVGLPLLIAALALALVLVGRWRVDLQRVAACCLVVISLFGVGAARVLRPLRFVDTTSEMQRLRSEIDARLAAGEDLQFPIAVREPGPLKVRFFFGEDFEIVAVPQEPPSEVHFLLVAERRTPGPPKPAVDRRPAGAFRPPP